MQRSKHNLSNYKLLTCDIGELIPVQCQEVLPGDTFQGRTSALVRTLPLLAPLMHPVDVRFHHWFVPMRLVWDDWETFITGGVDGTGDGVGNIPTITGPFGAGGVLDYLGIPPGIDDLEVSALPLRCYNKIYNEFYRDNDLMPERGEDQNGMRSISWQKDYFTSARPWPQRGPDVVLSIGDQAPVNYVPGTNNAQQWLDSQTDNQAADGAAEFDGGTITNTNPADEGFNMDPNGTYIADLSQATANSVVELRKAFAQQRYQEARARYGARYTEYLRYLNVVPNDARLQRPEYLGGGKHSLVFSEVLSTADTAGSGANDTVVGALKGHGISAVRTRKFTKFFPEHGYMMTMMSVRPKTMYNDGVPKHFTRQIKEDYWQKELQYVGQDEILNKEIFAQGDSEDDGVFGYQDRYDEYRSHPNTVAGEMRDDTYNFWHMGRQFTELPVLNEDFATCDPGKRFFAEQTTDGLQIMVNNQLRSRRMVAKHGDSRVF